MWKQKGEQIHISFWPCLWADFLLWKWFHQNLGDLVMNIMMICSWWLHHVFILVYCLYKKTCDWFSFLLVIYKKKTCDLWLQGGRTYPNWKYQTLQMVLIIWNPLVFGVFLLPLGLNIALNTYTRTYMYISIPKQNKNPDPSKMASFWGPGPVYLF